MSHKMTLVTELRERDFICAALDALEVPYDVGENICIVGHYGNVVDRGEFRITKSALRKAGISAMGDVGFKLTDDGAYQMIFDGMDQSRLQTGLVEPLTQQYNVAAALAWAEAEGYSAEIQHLENGDIQIVTMAW